MYYGNYRISLDERDRIRIPSKLRAKYPLDATLYLMQGTSQSLFLVTQEELDRILQTGKDYKLLDNEIQNALRKIYSTVFSFDEDNQGRFVLPEKLKIAAKIDRKLVFAGMGSRVEIWAEEVYDENDFDGENATENGLKILARNGVNV